MSYVIAILALSAACVLWYLVQRWSSRGPDGGREETPDGCGPCAHRDTCAESTEAPKKKSFPIGRDPQLRR